MKGFVVIQFGQRINLRQAVHDDILDAQILLRFQRALQRLHQITPPGNEGKTRKRSSGQDECDDHILDAQAITIDRSIQQQQDHVRHT
ncbi:hypothetical protein D3C75_974730 [compost metagenome]